MSAPTPAPGDDRPREGYYPDPSIPGYVRYWNGASWMPGTSRPAPKDGEPLAPPPGARASVEETGPHFFDEDPVEEAPPAAASQHGGRPEPASAWGADGSHRSGYAGDPNHLVAWPGTAQGPDPRVPHAREAGGAAADAGSENGTGGSGRQGSGTGSAGGGTASDPRAAGADGSAGAASGEAEAGSGNTFVFRRPTEGAQGTPAADGAADDGTLTFRAVPGTGGPGFGTGQAAQGPGAGAPTAPSGPQRTGGATGPAVPHQAAAPLPAASQQPAGPLPVTSQPVAPLPATSQPVAPLPAASQPAGPLPGAAQPAGPQPAAPAPITAGPGGGQSSWAQQVHQLAGAGGDEQPVAPWKPPVEDVFQAAARRQAAARPAGLGKRLAARLIDTLVLAAVTAVAAVPLGTKAIDHVNDKIDEAKLSGETVTVWLLDGTTATYLGIVLAVLLLFGVVYEALPTAKWGRTLGKKLLGLEVRDIEGHEPPSFGASLRRWLVYSVPGLLAVGVVGVAWCLFDRPWHQCWHDKAARTFVAH
ncbi:RDD family protein [Streptomyces lancefieldiae]|uniref:RDD family protein n=1 Tax=Streptomyces lancefieldiae TaxID=3075520 RepID=A0ABU3AS57_9ACTN|nr:RDD family protein [Streptomyces sp. DSM 40712]MDT0613032.1 RDD family protein [Streptomyces sp. DSM 40712]